MSDQAKLARDLAIMILAAGLILAALELLGPVYALVMGMIVLPAAAMIALLAVTFAKALDETDEWCSRVDSELDDEMAARRALRVQNTVRAQVIPVDFGRRRTDGAA